MSDAHELKDNVGGGCGNKQPRLVARENHMRRRKIIKGVAATLAVPVLVSNAAAEQVAEQKAQVEARPRV